MSYNNTGIPIAAQFNLKSPTPVDSRYVITNSEQLSSLIEDEVVYPGLSFALTSESTYNETVYSPGIYRFDVDGHTLRRIDTVDVVAINDDEIAQLFSEVPSDEGVE